MLSHTLCIWCRYTLCMVSYIAVAIVVTTYVGCCGVHTTWHSFVGKVGPTAVGPTRLPWLAATVGLDHGDGLASRVW